jgi:hypothetical protein
MRWSAHRCTRSTAPPGILLWLIGATGAYALRLDDRHAAPELVELVRVEQATDQFEDRRRVLTGRA